MLEWKRRLHLQKNEHNILSLGRGAKYCGKEAAAEHLLLKIPGWFCTTGHEPQHNKYIINQIQTKCQWSTAYYLKENHLSSLLSFLAALSQVAFSMIRTQISHILDSEAHWSAVNH